MSGYGAFGGAKNRTPSAGAPLYHGEDLGSDSLAASRERHSCSSQCLLQLFQPGQWFGARRGRRELTARKAVARGGGRESRCSGPVGQARRWPFISWDFFFHQLNESPLGGLGFLPPELTATSSAQLPGSKSLLQDFQESAQRSPPAGSLAELPPAQGRGASGRLVP